ncbi:LIM domain-containing protein 1 [Sphaeramia orbicularis]|uniref:LIM domain-containing protein 1 n=1 Tax=Sphaeramia orbicularis TaxID=375764 RepID=UPI00117ECC91|nr:LIM domain-containing protein 1-like [Sphaeramia orbicularis]
MERYEEVLQARGKSYHLSCFRCVICRQSLEGLPFSVDTDNRVYCVSDYHKVQAPPCVVCRLPILPTEGSTESIRVVSLNRNYHVECYGSELFRTVVTPCGSQWYCVIASRKSPV